MHKRQLEPDQAMDPTSSKLTFRQSRISPLKSDASNTRQQTIVEDATEEDEDYEEITCSDESFEVDKRRIRVSHWP